MQTTDHSHSSGGHRPWVLIMLVLILVEITSAFETGMMFGALATISREFRDPVGAGWLVTAFLLVGAGSAALTSRFGDMYGRKRVAVILLLLAVTGSVVSALAPDLALMTVGRAIQGFSAALLPLCVGLVREHLPAKRIPLAIGFLAAMAASSAGLGIMLGGWAVDQMGWRSVFWFSAGHAALAAVCLAWVLPPSKLMPSTDKLDVLGGLLFAPAVAALLFGITRLKTSMTDPVTMSIIAASVVVLAIWVRYEWHHPKPMLDVRLFTQRQIGITMLMTVFYGLGTSQQMLLILQLAQQPDWTGIGLGLSATSAATIKLPSILMGLLGATWCGWLAGRAGGRTAALWVTLIVCAGWVQFSQWHDSVWALVAASVVISFGSSALYAVCVQLVTEAVPAQRTSEINGQLQVVRSVSYAAGTVFATMLLASATLADESKSSGLFSAPEAYHAAMHYVIACCMLCVVSALGLTKGSGPRDRGHHAMSH